jgi:ribosomal protein L11 methyltransferase
MRHDAGMRWWELSFSWERAALGVAVARLRQHGLHSCVLDGETDGIARLRAFLPVTAPRSLVLGLAHHLEEEARNRGLAPPGVCFRQTDTCEALAAWPPMDIGRRLRVQPAGHPLPPPGERAVVQLLPRAAFGTTHATTRLCLEALEGRELEGSRVADIGCGSGVLALAAIRLGAREVHAVDVDPLAVATTLENRVLNAVPEHTLHVTHGSVEALACDRVELILCNTLLAVLEQVIPRMANLACPDGRALLSGIREADVPRVQTVCRDWGWAADGWRIADGWAMIETRREATATGASTSSADAQGGTR